MDLGVVDSRFTWQRKVNNRIIMSKRLDRALGNIDWRVEFPEAFVEVLNRVHSDHNPIMIQCGARHPFRFVAAWTEHP